MNECPDCNVPLEHQPAQYEFVPHAGKRMQVFPACLVCPKCFEEFETNAPPKLIPEGAGTQGARP